MDLQVRNRPIDELVPYARNARTHSPDQVAQIAASIKEFGFIVPVLLDGENGIIAGHGRVQAARRLGLAEVPCIEAKHLTEAQKRAFVLADNKLAMNAGWDEDLLRVELADLKLADFDVSLTGFSTDEIAELMAAVDEPLQGDPDDVPEPPVVAVSRPGDLWMLGRHRLLCGDSTKATDVERVLAGVKPHLMVTDPPYGVQYDPEWRAREGLAGTGVAKGKVANDDRADWREAWALFPGDVAYVWHAGVAAGTVQDSLAAAGFETRAQIIWAKSSLVIGRGHYHWQHEPCWYAVRDGATGHWQGDRTQTTLWQIEKPKKNETGHSTQKPVECMRRPIENNSSRGQAVYEPFSGSGTTLVAGEQTGRAVHAIELDPRYVDVAVQRWQTLTGQKATLDGDGRSFDDLKAERESGPEEEG